MKYPDLHIAAKDAVTCHDLCQDLVNILTELTDLRVPQVIPEEIGYSARRIEVANNGVIFVDTIRDRLNEIRGLLVNEAGGPRETQD